MSGSRFYSLLGAGARLSRALIDFMLDLHTREHGYTEIEPPLLVRSRGAARHRQPAEVRGRSLQDRRRLGPLPDPDRRSAAHEPPPRGDARRARSCRCSTRPTRRASAARRGRTGQDVRGLIRVHQFHKVEMVKFALPEQSYDELESMTRQRRRGAEAARPAVPDGAAVHGRHGLCLGEDVRHRGVAAEPEDVSRDQLLQQHRGVPGAAGRDPVPARRTGRSRSSCTRSTARAWPWADAARHPRELPAAATASVVVPEVLRPYMRGLEVIEPRAW